MAMKTNDQSAPTSAMMIPTVIGPISSPRLWENASTEFARVAMRGWTMSLRNVTNDGHAKAKASPVISVRTAWCHVRIVPVPIRMAWMMARMPMNALIVATSIR